MAELKLGSEVTYRPPDSHGYPGGGGVVFSKDPGQLESRSVSVRRQGRCYSAEVVEGSGTRGYFECIFLTFEIFLPT